MSAENGGHVTELIAELALGVSAGEERGSALAHLAACHACRRDLEAMSEIGDDLLLLAPPSEPPSGFEGRVIERLEVAAGRKRRRPVLRRLAAGLAAALLGATSALGVAHLATREQREFSALYARALDMAGGSYFGALPLRDAGGRSAGHVFGYAGEPSWVFVVVDAPPASGPHDVRMVTEDGGVVELGTIELHEGQGTLGAALPGRLREMAVLRVSGPGTGVLRAVSPPSDH